MELTDSHHLETINAVTLVLLGLPHQQNNCDTLCRQEIISKCVRVSSDDLMYTVDMVTNIQSSRTSVLQLKKAA